jgi:invasion protein IalB
MRFVGREAGMRGASKLIVAGIVPATVFGITLLAYGQSAPSSAQHPAAQTHQVKPAPPSAASASPPAPAAAADAHAADNVLPSRWTSRCASEARSAALDCAVEQSAIITQTGQLLASITVRVPADTRRPVLMIQLPVGLFLPAGITIKVDDGKPQEISLQTCDLKGCYGAAPLPDETLAAMKTGKRFAISFQNVSKENIVIPFGLSNFAEVYERIQ